MRNPSGWPNSSPRYSPNASSGSIARLANAAFRHDLLHLDEVDPHALAAEAPQDQPKGGAHRKAPRAALVALAIAAVVLLLCGLFLGRLLAGG